MHYFGYVIIILAIVAGYTQAPILLVPLFALVSTFAFSGARRKATKEDQSRPGALVDGIYLFAVQCLILFTAYLMGHFGGTEAGDMLWRFMTGQR